MPKDACFVMQDGFFNYLYFFISTWCPWQMQFFIMRAAKTSTVKDISVTRSGDPDPQDWKEVGYVFFHSISILLSPPSTAKSPGSHADGDKMVSDDEPRMSQQFCICFHIKT